MTYTFTRERLYGEEYSDVYGSVEINATSNISNTAIDLWDNDGIPLSRESNLSILLDILSQPHQQQSIDIYTVSQQFHISTAENKSLDKIGELVGVSRQLNESDDEFEARIKSTFNSSITDTSTNDTIEFIATLLNVNVSEIEISFTINSEPVIEIILPQSKLDDLNVSIDNFTTFINQVSPSSHRIDIIQQGTFEVREVGQINDPSKGLIIEGGSDGGKLAEVVN